MTERKPYVFLATPMFGGMCYGSYAGSLASTVTTFTAARVPLVFQFTFNESLITRARDTLVHDFLLTPCTHLMFVDADIEFSGEDVLSLLDADKEIIFGLYPLKAIDWDQVVEAVKRGVSPREMHAPTYSMVGNTPSGEVPDDSFEPVEAINGGTGFMLIRREVLEGLADKVPEYSTGDPRVSQHRKQFFDTSIDPDTGILLSEDYHFCKLARANGYRIWAAPWVRLSHIGPHKFS